MSQTIASDIAALIHALQGGNASAVDAAVAALGMDVRAGGGAAAGATGAAGAPAADATGAAAGPHGPDIGGAASFAQGHHFEHVWG
jgi:hypothetical protein